MAAISKPQPQFAHKRRLSHSHHWTLWYNTAPSSEQHRIMSDQKKYRIYLCGGPSCTPRGRDALLRALEDELWAAQLDDVVDVRVSGCQDRCDFAPNITVWPGPHHYSNLTVAAIKQIVQQHLLKGQPVGEFLVGEEARR